MALSLLEKGSDLSMKLANNMINNLKTANDGGVDTIRETARAFMNDLTRDMKELKEYNENYPYWESHFNLATDIIQYKLMYGFWDSLKDTVGRIISHLGGKFTDLKNFFHKTIKDGAETLRPHFLNIKELAKDLLAHIGEIHRSVAIQALEFFKPFARQLGGLYFKLVDKIHERLHAIANPETY